MAFNSLLARCQQATRRLMDTADWTHDGATVALQGVFDPRQDSGLDGRARPLQPEFTLLSEDDAGITLGDTLAIGGYTYDVAGIHADQMGETRLALRVHRD